MGLSTHVLDTVKGGPAAGMSVRLWRLEQENWILLKAVQLNADGRVDGGLLDVADLTVGRYRLTFDVASYFRKQGVPLADPPFLDVVPLEFGLAHVDQHYHVPLLVSPWAYSTYRGS